jgi:DNA-binding NarL/FixJ family response regulator
VSNITVLVVDDAPDMRLLLRVNLQTDGRFDVVGEAEDGLEALDLTASLKPDAVLLDIAMPKMDGLEAIPEIHRLSPTSRIVVFTGFDARVGERALSLTAHAYVPKSAGFPTVATAIVEACVGGNGKTMYS